MLHNRTQTSSIGAAPARVRLSPLEDVMCRLYDACDGDGTGGIAARVEGWVDERHMRLALSRLQALHPKLQGRIPPGRRGRRYLEVPALPNPIPLDVVDVETPAIRWQPHAWNELGRPLDVAAGPLGRMLVLRSRSGGICELLLVQHHAVADGSSYLRLLSDLLEFYGEAEVGGPAAAVVPRPVVTARRARARGTALGRLRLAARIARLRRAKRRGDWTPLPAGPAGGEPYLERRALSESATAAFVGRCRGERTSVAGALFAAAVCALTDVVPEPRIRVRCRLPINIRSSLVGSHGPVTDLDIGCFLSGYEWARALDGPPPFWPLARGIREELLAFAAQGGPELLYNLIRFARMSTLTRAPRRETLAVSSLGIAPVRRRYGTLTLTECGTVARNSRLGPSLGVIGVTVSGRLCVTVGTGGVAHGFSAAYEEALHRRLLAAAAPAS